MFSNRCSTYCSCSCNSNCSCNSDCDNNSNSSCNNYSSWEVLTAVSRTQISLQNTAKKKENTREGDFFVPRKRPGLVLYSVAIFHIYMFYTILCLLYFWQYTTCSNLSHFYSCGSFQEVIAQSYYLIEFSALMIPLYFFYGISNPGSSLSRQIIFALSTRRVRNPYASTRWRRKDLIDSL